MANERITEDIVRNHFKSDPLFKSIKFEEQKSYNRKVVDLLQAASKSGKGVGKPEFIISFPTENIDYLLVIECKANLSDHQSQKLDNPKGYAVDGVLHYAKALSVQFDVVAIAVSGQTEQELIAVKKRILDKHHLKAVLSMPDELFNPNASVVICIMVFEANKKHEGRKTWFGYFKDDGFEKRKQKGRIDARGKWNNIKKQWINAYNNLDEVAGLSVKQEVKGEDEWCAEAYMTTDYSILNRFVFERRNAVLLCNNRTQ